MTLRITTAVRRGPAVAVADNPDLQIKICEHIVVQKPQVVKGLANLILLMYNACA